MLLLIWTRGITRKLAMPLWSFLSIFESQLQGTSCNNACECNLNIFLNFSLLFALFANVACLIWHLLFRSKPLLGMSEHEWQIHWVPLITSTVTTSTRLQRADFFAPTSFHWLQWSKSLVTTSKFAHYPTYNEQKEATARSKWGKFHTFWAPYQW